LTVAMAVVLLSARSITVAVIVWFAPSAAIT
jgi:hypothetical protein